MPERTMLFRNTVTWNNEIRRIKTQLGEHRSAEREVASTNPGQANTAQSLNNWEESAAFVMTVRVGPVSQHF